MAGLQLPTFGPKTPVLPTSQFGNPATFTAAANTQAGDYDKIMSQYADFARQSLTNPQAAIGSISPISSPQIGTPTPISPTSVAPQLSQYQQSGDVTGSLAALSNLTATGGYSDADIANLRARGISPTRSIYANAQQNVERQRALQGGYSPSFNATQAQMARDESNQISDINTNVNAGIAQNVAANKLSAAPSYASASATANASKTQADQANAAIVNEINRINEQNRLQTGEFNTSMQNQINQMNAQNQLQTAQFNTQTGLTAAQMNAQNALANKQLGVGAIQGQASLYGTTPALTNLFGNQVVQAGQLGQGQQAINLQKLNTYGNLASTGGFGGNYRI